MNAEAIKAGIANNMRGQITGLGQVNDYVRAQVTPPAADIRRGTIEYDQSMMGGIHHWVMLVRVYVATVTDKGAQALLDSFLDPEGASSVKAAIESDRTLGGVVSDIHVTEATGEQTYTSEGQAPLLGSEWTVEVWL